MSDDNSIKEEAKHWKAVADAQKEFEAVAKNIANGNGKGKADKDKDLPVFHTYKYSKPGLHEAAIINGLPFFLKYDPVVDKIMTVKQIQENSRILKPPGAEEYPYTPYEFANAEEPQQYLEIAKHENIDSLYKKAKAIVRKYNDQDDYKLNLIAIDIVWSYFQDKFGTTHYIGITGENDSGKSSFGNTFGAIAYRTVNMTSPSAANVFRVLGMIEAGQCTLVLDESERISDDPEIMDILRSGYDIDKKVPKTNSNTWRQEWYFTYCLKIMIAERSPSKLKAKGLLDRTLLFSTFPGDSELDIKEVTNPHETAPHLERALAELLDFRKFMLVYRLIRFNDSIPDLDIGVKRRNKELCKPYIRLFYGFQSQNEVQQTFQTFLDAKSDKKSTSLEAILIPVIIDLVEERGNEAFSKDIWNFIKERLDGETDPYDPNGFHVSGYTLYRNTVTKLLEDKFGASYKHTEKGGKIIFNPDKLQKIQKSYDSDIKIKTRLRPKTDGTDDTDGILEIARESITETIHTKNNANASQNEELNDIQKPQAVSQEPSGPSEPSGSPLTEKEKVKARTDYDRSQSKIRKMKYWKK